MKKSREDRIFDIVNIIIMSLILLTILYPLYFVITASISDPYQVATGKVVFWPRGFTFMAYRNVFANGDVWIGYRNTIAYTVLGTLLSLALTITSAYVLSKKEIPGVKAITWYFLITMYFSGGLIPTYLLVKDIDLLNKPYTMILLGAFSVYNLIISISYFRAAIPDSLYEAANIDGASMFRVFISIALPLSAPIVAVIALYYAVSQWNGFFNALVFLSDRQLMPLQIILRNILIYNQMALQNIMTQGAETEEVQAAAALAYMAGAMKYALIIIAAIPLLAVYPFVQKYFVKGVMIGSIKG